MPSAHRELTRDEKAENLVVNFSMIMMGMFEGVFTALAAGMATALSKTADALTEALDSGEPRPKQKKNDVNVEAEVNSKVRDVFSGLRKEVAQGFSNKDASFKAFLKDPSFDAGIRIVEGHPLKLPSLTQALSDEDLAGYVDLLQKEDPEMVKLMQELGEWQKTTPKFDR